MTLDKLNELTKEIKKGVYLTPYGQQTLSDLIQLQQAEIEALKARIEFMVENASHHEGIAHAGGFEAGWQSAQAEIEALKAEKIRAYNNGYEDGRKPNTGSNEPVAWIDYLEHSDVYDLNVSGRGIPLYTHPAKTLTDEEIYKIYCEVEDTKCPSDDFEYMMFAKAILRKANEK